MDTKEMIKDDIDTLHLDDDIVQVMSFAIDGRDYGVTIASVQEIKGWVGATRIPNSPDFVIGVMNLRGTIIPIFDMKCRFSTVRSIANENNVIMIVSSNDKTVGILVDKVSDILDVKEQDIMPAPTDDSSIDCTFVDGLISVANGVITILNLDNLFATYDT